jgi:hypothetical protein
MPNRRVQEVWHLEVIGELFAASMNLFDTFMIADKGGNDSASIRESHMGHLTMHRTLVS